MTYRATIINNGNKSSKEFTTMQEAAQWLDSENNNLEATTIIESFYDSGKKKDEVRYTEKA